MSIHIHEMGALFERVQMQNIFSDGKTFPDCLPKINPERIINAYQHESSQSNFKLADFVKKYFDEPSTPQVEYQTNPNKTAEQHINELWSVLMRKPDQEN